MVAGIPVHSIRMQGIVAKQDVFLGGSGEMLTISHETLSPSAYEPGIMLALRRISGLRGITLGLDTLLGLSLMGSGSTQGAGGPL